MAEEMPWAVIVSKSAALNPKKALPSLMLTAKLPRLFSVSKLLITLKVLFLKTVETGQVFATD